MQQRNASGRRKPEPRETEIDILYENERGGFLCGSALFSAQALGGLDATPWSTSTSTTPQHKQQPFLLTTL